MKEKNNLWVDSNGNPISLFQVGEIYPTGREEHLIILSKYLQEDLSVKDFCERYNIPSAKKFQKMLDIFALEDDNIAQQLQEKNNKAEEKQNKAMIDKSTLAMVGKVGLGMLPVDKLIGVISFEDAVKCAQDRWSQQRGGILLARQVIDYFYNRINSFDKVKNRERLTYEESRKTRGSKIADVEDLDKVTDPKNLKKMLTKDEIKFITGDKNYKLLDMKDNLIRALFLTNTTDITTADAKYYAKKQDVSNGLSIYATKFSKDKYFENTTFIKTDRGEVEITQDMVNQAYNFALDNNLFPSKDMINYAIQAVANGKIKHSPVSAERQKVIDKSFDIVQREKDLASYLSGIDELVSE